MSITAELRTSARSAYRNLLRAASSTFRGDPTVLQAFRHKARVSTEEGASQTDPKAYATNVQLARDVAGILRKNVVQGVRVSQPQETRDGGSEDDLWHLQLTEHSELGFNESIKTAGKKDQGNTPGSCRSARRREKLQGEQAGENAATDNSPPTDADPFPPSSPLPSTSTSPAPRSHINYSTLKRLHKSRVVPVLHEKDLEESFVRGSGPGGQSINKTQNNVQLLHKPSGIRVTCQETRSLSLNRERARKILLEKLDKLANPGLSKGELARAKQVERERRRKKKAKKRAKGRESESQMDD